MSNFVFGAGWMECVPLCEEGCLGLFCMYPRDHEQTQWAAVPMLLPSGQGLL